MSLSAINPAVLIPVRRGSTRFPNKPLVMIGDKPLISHCVRAACDADIGPVYVITDDELIRRAVKASFPTVDVIVADPPAATGTDRCAWATLTVDSIRRHNVIVNMQGDILTIDPPDLRAVLYPLTHRGMVMSTLSQAAPTFRPWDFLNDRHAVKVTRTSAGPAFWRTTADVLPGRRENANRVTAPALSHTHRHHIGVYAFPTRFLHQFASWLRSPTELALDLEQWRALDHDANIGVWDIAGRSHAINVPADLNRFNSPGDPVFFTG